MRWLALSAGAAGRRGDERRPDERSRAGPRRTWRSPTNTARAWRRTRSGPQLCTARRREAAMPRHSTASAGCTPTGGASRATMPSPPRCWRWPPRRATTRRAEPFSSSATERASLPDCMLPDEPVVSEAPPEDAPRSVRRFAAGEAEDCAAGDGAGADLHGRPAAGACRHRRRVELRPECAIAKERARADATHSGYGDPVQGQERIRHPRQRARWLGLSALACCRTTAAMLRLPPPRTTPARPSSTGTAVCRRTRKRAAMCSAFLRCSAASVILTIPALAAPPAVRHVAVI